MIELTTKCIQHIIHEDQLKLLVIYYKFNKECDHGYPQSVQGKSLFPKKSWINTPVSSKWANRKSPDSTYNHQCMNSNVQYTINFKQLDLLANKFFNKCLFVLIIKFWIYYYYQIDSE